jgi:hypothetical protein
MTDKKCSMCGQLKSESSFYMKRPALGQRYSQCIECWKVKTKAWWAGNPGKITAYCRKWAAKNPIHTRSVYREMKRRKDAIPSSRFASRVRSAVSNSIVRGSKRIPTYDLLGYSKESLMAHLERQFSRGMTWENYGEWHIDHITPLASFGVIVGGGSEFRAAWALANLRPLWASDNIRKSDTKTHLI